MSETTKSPVATMRDLREALRDGEHIMVNGKPWREVFCEMYDYAAMLEDNGPAKRSAKAGRTRAEARLLLYAIDVGDEEGFAIVRKRLERRIGYSAWAGLRTMRSPAKGEEKGVTK